MKLHNYPTRAEWLAARRLGLGGSDIPAILGISPYSTPLQVWSSKVGLDEEREESYVLRRGSHMEPLLWRELAAEVPGLRAIPQSMTIVEGDEPWMRYSPDAFLAIETPGNYVEALGEGKSHPRGASEWDDGVPPHVVAQVQWGMHVCARLPLAYVAVDLGTEFKWARVGRDPDWWPTHEETIRAFWRSVETETPPAPTGDEGDTSALARMFPREAPGKIVSLPGAMISLAEAWDAAAAAEKAAAAERERIGNEIRAAMKDAERVVLPDGSGWTWRVQERVKRIADPSGEKTVSRVLLRAKARKER